MAKYQKKPVVVDIEKYEPGMEDGFVVDGRYYDKKDQVPRTMRRVPAIKTLEGFHEIGEKDYIVTGVQGERYPIKPDIKEATYEKVED